MSGCFGLQLPAPGASALLPRLDALGSRTFLDPVVESMAFLPCSGHRHNHFPPNTHTLGPHNVESWSRITAPILKGKKQIVVIKCPIWGSLAGWGQSRDTNLGALAAALPRRSFLCCWLRALFSSSLSHSAHASAVHVTRKEIESQTGKHHHPSHGPPSVGVPPNPLFFSFIIPGKNQ